MRLFDSHAHLYDAAFDSDRDKLIPALFEKIDYILCPSEDVESSRKAAALAERYDHLYAAAGLHPLKVEKGSSSTLSDLEDLIRTHPKVKAVGETGLDYHFSVPRKLQQEWFIREMQLAQKVSLPLIIHDREAHGDTLSLLRAYGPWKAGGVMHSFSGSVETARECVKMGFYISFSGSVVYSGSTRLHRVAESVPMDRLLIETDSPFQTPPPHRGERNTPFNVYYVARKLAELRDVSLEEMAEQTTKNALKAYHIEI